MPAYIAVVVVLLLLIGLVWRLFRNAPYEPEYDHPEPGNIGTLMEEHPDLDSLPAMPKTNFNRFYTEGANNE